MRFALASTRLVTTSHDATAIEWDVASGRALHVLAHKGGINTVELGSDEVSVRASVQDSLPSVRGDAERLRQVLMNLLDNAIKYSPEGDEVEVRAYSEDGRIRVDVRDNGPGIAREDQRLIFEKFGRVTTGNARPGTGLGLFIARSIAEAHGGTLEVSSALERGAVFSLALPSRA